VCSSILPLRKSEGIIDRLVFLGDYMDRDVNGHLVLDYLIEIHKKYKDQVIFLFGNHEQILLSALNLMPNQNISLQSQDMWYRTWLANGGLQTLMGYLERVGNDTPAISLPRWRVKDIIPKEHIEFLQTVPVNFYETDSFIFVHGGCDPHLSVSKQEPEVLWWDRSLCKFVKKCIDSKKEDQIDWNKCIVTGHNASIKPIIHEKFMMLDISATRKELLLTELNSLSAMCAHVDKSKLIAYELQETDMSHGPKSW